MEFVVQSLKGVPLRCCMLCSDEEQSAAIKFTYPMFSKPTPSSQFLEELSK